MPIDDSSADANPWQFIANSLYGDPVRRATEQMTSAGYPIGDVAGYQGMMGFANANKGFRVAPNPFDMGVANQSRDGYIQALYAAQNSPSALNNQANRSMGALNQNVVAAQGASRSPLGQLLAARAGAQNGGNMANQAGQAGLAEQMQRFGSLGQGLGQLRGQDLKNMGAYTREGAQAQTQADALADFYTKAGYRLMDANRRFGLTRDQTQATLDFQGRKQNTDNVNNDINAVATAGKIVAGL